MSTVVYISRFVGMSLLTLFNNGRYTRLDNRIIQTGHNLTMTSQRSGFQTRYGR